jgi:dTDP-4-dehydrorhamnose reductase
VTRILVTGKNGQVGWELRRSLQCIGDVIAVDREQFDLARPDSLALKLDELAPDIIVNAAAYTAVDKAESEQPLAMSVNAESPGVMAEWAARRGVPMLHYSTDYVFDGRAQRPYTEDDATVPLSVYGVSKLAGEQGIAASGAPHLIFRTSWVYAARGRNFLRTMIRLMREREELAIVNDQYGAPTWARSIADATAAVLARASADPRGLAAALRVNGGVFHLVASGETTWHGFAMAIAKETSDPLRRLRRLLSITTAQFPTAAARPANSILSTDRLLARWHVRLPRWDQALRLCLEECPDGVAPMPAADQ